MKQNKHRLPDGVKPLKYKLQITPNLSDFSFAGQESIQIKIEKPTKKLILHSLELNILSAVWVSQGQQQPAKIYYHKKSETVEFVFSKMISGTGRLSLNFAGTISDRLQGFYKSKFIHNKQEKYIATTQLEATDARRFFPCFDEPAHKATFQVSVIVPKHLQIISNTIESAVLPHNDPSLKIVHFETTPKMSTYLLALIIGEFEHLKTKSKHGVLIRVHTTPGKKAQSKFALETTKRALEFLEDYFGIPYPMPVLDMVAIPDFAAGAMENWGAITFRETALLVDDNHTTFIGRQRVAEVIAHELVHQWFGNLVTMEWWTHLWLNESFATYMAYLTVDNLFPEWNFWTKFVLQEQSIALRKDSLHSSQPIEVEVKFPNEISESFDPAIVYAKGASVLRMLASYIGAEDFRKGLQIYLKKHSYKNTESIHLWEAFQKASGKPVKKFMSTWTQKQGFPVVSVERHNSDLFVTQKPFNFLAKKSSDQLWTIPLSISTKLNPDEVLNYDISGPTAKFVLPANHQMVKLNYQESSFFITNYSVSILAELLPRLQNQTLNNVDRLALLRNAFLLVRSGDLDLEIYLEMLGFLGQEDSYIVWAEVSSALGNLEQTFYKTKLEDLLFKFKQKIFAKLINNKKIGLTSKPNESDNLKTLRGLALLESGQAGFGPSKKFAKTLLAKKISGKKIDPNLRFASYSIVAKFGTKQDFNKLLQIFQESSLAQEQQQILIALTNFQEQKIQDLVLDFFLSGQVRDQDLIFALHNALKTPGLKVKAWSRIKKDWGTLEKKYGSSKMLGTIISGASSFNSEQELNDFLKFTKSSKIKGAKQAIKQTTEKIQVKIALKSRSQGQIQKFLLNQFLQK